MGTKTKKVILYLVEGPTDEDALSPVLKKVFHREEVRFHVVHGDMTSNWRISGANAVKTVYEHMELERKRYGFEKRDIIKVIHLVDIDGAFIPEDRVLKACSGFVRLMRLVRYLTSFIIFHGIWSMCFIIMRKTCPMIKKSGMQILLQTSMAWIRRGSRTLCHPGILLCQGNFMKPGTLLCRT